MHPLILSRPFLMFLAILCLDLRFSWAFTGTFANHALKVHPAPLSLSAGLFGRVSSESRHCCNRISLSAVGGNDPPITNSTEILLSAGAVGNLRLRNPVKKVNEPNFQVKKRDVAADGNLTGVGMGPLSLQNTPPHMARFENVRPSQVPRCLFYISNASQELATSKTTSWPALASDIASPVSPTAAARGFSVRISNQGGWKQTGASPT